MMTISLSSYVCVAPYRSPTLRIGDLWLQSGNPPLYLGEWPKYCEILWDTVNSSYTLISVKIWNSSLFQGSCSQITDLEHRTYTSLGMYCVILSTYLCFYALPKLVVRRSPAGYITTVGAADWDRCDLRQLSSRRSPLWPWRKPHPRVLRAGAVNYPTWYD